MDFIEVGQIVNTHGIRGEIKLNPWTDNIYDLLEQGVFYLKDGKELHVWKSRIHKNCLIIQFAEISDVDTAQKYKGTVLFTEKTELPEGRYYIADLLGMEVFDCNGRLGTLCDVFQTGANDVYEVKNSAGKSIYIPVIDGVILTVDVKARRMEVSLPKGLLEEEEE